MLRRHHRFFQSMQVARDVIVVWVAFAFAHAARFSFPELLPYRGYSDNREVAAVGMMLLAVWPVVGWASGLYVSRRSRSIAAEFLDSLRATVVAFLVVVTVTYFLRDVRFSRATLILWVMFNLPLMTAARASSRILLRELRSRGYNQRHVLLVGTGDLARGVLRTLDGSATLGIRVAGIVADDDRANLVGTEIDGYPVMGTLSELRDLIAAEEVDQVLVALPIERLGALKPIMNVLSQLTVDVRLIPDFYQFMTLCGSVEELGGMPVINLQATPLVGWNVVLKRAFDVSMGVLALAVSLPLQLLIAAAVRLSSPGPVFYAQERVGMDGQRFDMLKFRSMRVDAEVSGAQMTAENDPRRTLIGTFLRKTSLDELPQLWNVIRGDMSLVGPRPERPCFIDEFVQTIPRYALRHKIKSGMTGWAQVNGLRGNTSIKKRIELDLYYIENWSLSLDMRILLRTVFGGFLSPNAY